MRVHIGNTWAPVQFGTYKDGLLIMLVQVLLAYGRDIEYHPQNLKADVNSRSLGLCERCGGLKVVSCSKCKGLGTLSKGTLSIFSGIASDRRVGQEDASVPCRDCGSKGSLNCPKCSGA